MHKSKVAHIQKSLHLPSRRRVDRHALRQHIQVVVVLPLRHLRQRSRPIVDQPHPHQPIPLLRPVHIQSQPRRDRPTRMRRNAHTSPIPVIAQPMVAADDLIPLHISQAQRNPTVIADIPRRRHGPISQPIHHHTLIQQRRRKRLIRDLIRERHRIPERRQRPPVRLGKCAATRQRMHCLHIGRPKLRRRYKGRGGAHASL